MVDLFRCESDKADHPQNTIARRIAVKLSPRCFVLLEIAINVESKLTVGITHFNHPDFDSSVS